MECNDDEDCSSKHCLSHVCVECYDTSHCDGDKVCKSDHTCGYACTTDEECDGDKVCKSDHTCGYECTTDEECTDNKICTSDHTCVYECTANTDCDGICSNHKCAPCETSDQCDGDLVCGKNDSMTSNVCVECVTNDDCASNPKGNICNEISLMCEHMICNCQTGMVCEMVAPGTPVCITDKDACDLTQDSDCDGVNDLDDDGVALDACPHNPNIQTLADGQNCNINGDTFEIWHASDLSKLREALNSDSKPAKVALMNTVNLYDAIVDKDNEFKRVAFADVNAKAIDDATCLVKWTSIDLPEGTEFVGNGFFVTAWAPSEADPSVADICSLTMPLFGTIGANSKVDQLNLYYNMRGQAKAMFADNIKDSEITNLTVRANVNLEKEARLGEDARADAGEKTDAFAIVADTISGSKVQDFVYMGNWSAQSEDGSYIGGVAMNLKAGTTVERLTMAIDSVNLDHATAVFITEATAASKIYDFQITVKDVLAQDSSVYTVGESDGIPGNNEIIGNHTLPEDTINVDIQAINAKNENSLISSVGFIYFTDTSDVITGLNLKYGDMTLDHTNINLVGGHLLNDIENVSIEAGDIQVAKGAELAMVADTMLGAINGLKVKTGNITAGYVYALADDLSTITEKSLSNIDLEFGDMVFATDSEVNINLGFLGLSGAMKGVSYVEHLRVKTGNLDFFESESAQHFVFGYSEYLSMNCIPVDLKDASFEFGDVNGFDLFMGVGPGVSCASIDQLKVKAGDLNAFDRTTSWDTSVYGVADVIEGNLSNIWIELGKIQAKPDYNYLLTKDQTSSSTISNATVIARGITGKGLYIIYNEDGTLSNIAYYLDGNADVEIIRPFYHLYGSLTDSFSVYAALALKRDDKDELVLENGLPVLAQESDSSYQQYEIKSSGNIYLLSDYTNLQSNNAEIKLHYGNLKAVDYFGLGYSVYSEFSKPVEIVIQNIDTDRYFGIAQQLSSTFKDNISVTAGNIKAFKFYGGFESYTPKFEKDVSISTGNIEMRSTDEDFVFSYNNSASDLYFNGFTNSYDYNNIKGKLSISYGNITGVGQFNGLSNSATNPHDVTLNVGNVTQVSFSTDKVIRFFNGLANKIGGNVSNINMVYGDVNAAFYTTGFSNVLSKDLSITSTESSDAPLVSIQYGDIIVSPRGDFDGFVRGETSYNVVAERIQAKFGDISVMKEGYTGSVIGWYWGAGSSLSDSTFETGKFTVNNGKIYDTVKLGSMSGSDCPMTNVTVTIAERVGVAQPN